MRDESRHLAPADWHALTEQTAAQLATHVLGHSCTAELIQRRHRNEVFAIDDDFILKVYTRHGIDKLARKRAAHAILADATELTPQLVGWGTLQDDVTWTLETAVVTGPSEHTHPDQFGRHAVMGEFLNWLHQLQPPTAVAGGWEEGEDVDEYRHRRLSGAIGRLREVTESQDAHLVAEVRSMSWTDLPQVERAFVHGGFSAANTSSACDANSWTLLSVFDFEDAHPGDPAEDFALVALYGLHDVRLAGMLSRYSVSTGVDLRSIAFWTTVIALGILEWGPRLGDVRYTQLARSFLARLAATDQSRIS